MMLQWFSNVLGKALVVSDVNPLPVQHVAATATFEPGERISDLNPLPVTAS